MGGANKKVARKSLSQDLILLFTIIGFRSLGFGSRGPRVRGLGNFHVQIVRCTMYWCSV